MDAKTGLKKWGIGSSSLFLSIFAIMFSFTSINDKYFGEYILNGLNIRFPIAIISFTLLCMSALIGYRYRDDYLAKAGKIVSILFILLIIIMTVLSILF